MPKQEQNTEIETENHKENEADNELGERSTETNQWNKRAEGGRIEVNGELIKGVGERGREGEVSESD